MLRSYQMSDDEQLRRWELNGQALARIEYAMGIIEREIAAIGQCCNRLGAQEQADREEGRVPRGRLSHRLRGRPSEDDTRHHAGMDELLRTGAARSVRDAALQIARQIKGAGGLESVQRRLSRGYLDYQDRMRMLGQQRDVGVRFLQDVRSWMEKAYSAAGLTAEPQMPWQALVLAHRLDEVAAAAKQHAARLEAHGVGLNEEINLRMAGASPEGAML